MSDLQIRIDEVNATIEFGSLPTIEADATQMRMLLQNLLSNALKFAKPGVPPIVTVEANIETETSVLGDRQVMVLTVADNGIGFDNTYKDQIFKIFQRLHGRLEYEGTGVGLATVRKIVERHGGEIDADGRVDEGATFIIKLPAQQATEN